MKTQTSPIQVPKIGVMPALGIGTWRLSGRECEQSIKWALELGYRHIDTAAVYANHEAIAPAIKGFPREELFVVSKIIYEDLHHNNVQQACERILKELGTPYLDVLLIHWPSAEVAPETTLAAMMKLKEKQLIRHLGVSNFMIADLEKLEKKHFPILTNQIELHPYLQEESLTQYCQQNGMIVTAYRPIQKGEVDREPLLQTIGAKYKKTPVQVTLRWLFQRNIVSIPKASSKEHLLENISIFDFVLTQEEMQAIAQLEAGRRYVC